MQRSASTPRVIELLVTALAVLLVFITAGCKSTTSPSDDLPYRKTPVSALDPEPPEEMVRYLLDSGIFHISGAQPKQHRVAGFEDSIRNVVDLALGMVSEDSATHIPYVWGGKHVDRPTEWAKPPDSNASCAPRVGLDCSGFVQYVFERAGFGRQAPELNVASLANLDNWNFIANRGYYVFGLPQPGVSELLPGDVLIFSDGSGNLVHTGIFWRSDANINGTITPAFINSAGYSSCERCYSREASGQLTGVVVSPLGSNRLGKLVLAIRITEWSINFSALGYNFFGGLNDGVGSFVLDTTLGRLEVAGAEDTNDVSTSAFMYFAAENVTGAGTFTIPSTEYDAEYVAKFWYSGDDFSYPDSLFFYGSTPPSWWKGDPPTPEAGQVKVSVLSRGQYYGSIIGTFHFKPYSYYSRFEDSTYTIDTVTYTTTVTKYYSKQVDVTGRFSGLLGYK